MVGGSIGLAILGTVAWSVVLDEAVGDARVVATGESAHYNQEFFQLRHGSSATWPSDIISLPISSRASSKGG